MFEDLYENERGYFLGSTIVIEHGHDIDSGLNNHELIDGQQRITTLSILLAAIYAMLKKYKSESKDSEEDINTDLNNLKRRLVLKSPKGKTRLTPQVQGNNQADFYALLSENVTEEIVATKVKFAGNRKIYKAFKYFTNRIEKLVEESNNKYSDIQKYLEKVDSAIVVQISVTSTSEAYVLFESLNNRGEALSAVDLIKNTLLSKFPEASDTELDNLFNR